MGFVIFVAFHDWNSIVNSVRVNYQTALFFRSILVMIDTKVIVTGVAINFKMK